MRKFIFLEVSITYHLEYLCFENNIRKMVAVSCNTLLESFSEVSYSTFTH